MFLYAMSVIYNSVTKQEDQHNSTIQKAVTSTVTLDKKIKNMDNNISFKNLKDNSTQLK
ncbi:protein of unknown function [Tenacibaculum jejuense]|uniref:Uncharacterized protein n=2 Tax=Tenacibaculum jejuense TaxID=584609 RepID=A0A238U4W6_9FLAO|nr:protein of unknown function [Tenacibaculum jejuense]